MSDDLLKTCNGCNYYLTNSNEINRENEGDSSIFKSDQVCGKFVKTLNDQIVLCDEDEINALTEDGNHSFNEGNTPRYNCTLIGCPSECRYPFNSIAYENPPQSLDEFNNRIRNNNPNYLEFINDYTNEDIYKKGFYTLNDSSNVQSENLEKLNPDDEKLNNTWGGVLNEENNNCGNIVTPNDSNHYIKYPNKPSPVNFLNTVKGIRNLLGDVDWHSINKNSFMELTESEKSLIAQNPSEINENSYGFRANDTNNSYIPLTPNGIYIQWWKNGPRGELTEISDNDALIRQSTIDTSIDNFINLYNYLSERLQGTNYSFDRICIPQKREFELTRGFELSEEYIDDNNPVFSFLMNVDPTSEQNRMFNNCMNRLLSTEGDDDTQIFSLIKTKRESGTLTTIVDLGKAENKTILDYTERKIKKFLTLNPTDFDKCIDKITISTDNLCQRGTFPNALNLLGNILNIEMRNEEKNLQEVQKQEYENNLEIVSDTLLPYLPSIIKKLIAISKHYENINCRNISENTMILEKIYNDLLKKEISLYMPNLGINRFISSFSNNIFGRIILLLVAVYLITNIISLFKVNLNVQQ